MAALAKVWADRILASRKKEAKWRKLGRRIVKRYRDESGNPKEAKFNMLYANTSVLQPALFSQLPRPDVRRQYPDQPTAESQASEAIERCLTYYKDDPPFTRSVRQARDDMILAGRGLCRVKYESSFNKIGIIRTEADIDPETGEILVPEGFVDEFGVKRHPSDAEVGAGAIEEKAAEKVWVEYVYWEDFACADVRNWEDVWWIAYRHAMPEAEAKELFGKKAKLLNAPVKRDDNAERVDKEFEVWEVWNKRTRERYWVSPGSEEFFEKDRDPLGLKDFFDCPKPLYGIETTDTLVPVPPYIQYESQAVGLDTNVKRQASISAAMKMVGIYAGEKGEVLELMDKAKDGQLIPVETMDKSLRESIEWLPIQEGAVALQQLMLKASDMEKKAYQISGVSDIMRGDTKERESAAAQKIKASTGSLRLRPMREQIEEFIRDIYRIQGEIIAEKFSPVTINKITGMKLDRPTFEFLADPELRDFKIDIETDSTVQPDAQLEKQEMAEFLGALAPMLQQIAAVGQISPQSVPVLLKVMNEFLKTFKVNPKIEGELEKLGQTIVQQASQPKGPSEVQVKEAGAKERVEISTKGKIEVEKIRSGIKSAEGGMDRQIREQELVLGDMAKDEDRNAASRP